MIIIQFFITLGYSFRGITARVLQGLSIECQMMGANSLWKIDGCNGFLYKSRAALVPIALAPVAPALTKPLTLVTF